MCIANSRKFIMKVLHECVDCRTNLLGKVLETQMYKFNLITQPICAVCLNHDWVDIFKIMGNLQRFNAEMDGVNVNIATQAQNLFVNLCTHPISSQGRCNHKPSLQIHPRDRKELIWKLEMIVSLWLQMQAHSSSPAWWWLLRGRWLCSWRRRCSSPPSPDWVGSSWTER